MKQIEVDYDVFARIWAERKDNEFNENDVLRRLLLGADHSSQHSLRTSTAKGVQSRESDHVAELKEVKTSIPGIELSVTEGASEMGKVRWVDDIRTVLKQLGGQAELYTIYKEVERRRRAAGRSVPATLEAVVRRTLEDHSSDSANFRAENLFRLISRGKWGLR